MKKVQLKCPHCDYAKEFEVSQEQLDAKSIDDMQRLLTEEQMKAFRSVKTHIGVKHSKDKDYSGAFPIYKTL